ncbi:MAG TPA: histidine kinase, partial [Verrucomicrobiae bacterium]
MSRHLSWSPRLRVWRQPAVWLLAGLLASVPPGAAQPAAATNQELHSIEAIRNLSPEATTRKIPVAIHAVVTFFDETLYSHFVQDATSGIYLRFPTNMPLPQLKPGQTVKVTGLANPGEFAPVVLVDQITATGTAPLPPARPVSYEQLASGVDDSQFVEINGLVRAVQRAEGNGYYELELTTGGGRLIIYTRNLPVAKPEDLLDSIVRVRGVCSTQFNHQRQLFAIRLMVPRPEDLQLEQAGNQDPFAIVARPAASLLQYTSQASYGHRVKVVGRVTYYQPGKLLYLQDESRGLLAQTRSTAPLALGEVVEVLGFVSQGDYTPMLQDALFRPVRRETPMNPARITTDGALTGNFDCELVQIEARVIDRTRHGDEQYLLLQDSNTIFQASIRLDPAQDAFRPIANHSLVRVSGVCRIDPGEWHPGNEWRAKSFSILLRSVDDVTVLELPPWWTLEKLLWFFGALAFVTLAALCWVAILRRRVAIRTRQLEAEIQHRQRAERRREIEQERARVAHDLHDDLGARLTEVNMLTTLIKSPATSPAEKDRYLNDLSTTAHNMVTSLDEIVWAVNPRNDTIASLASYFGAYAQRLLDLAGIACGLDI